MTFRAQGRIATPVEEVHHVICSRATAFGNRPNSRSGKCRRKQGDQDGEVLVAIGRQFAKTILMKGKVATGPSTARSIKGHYVQAMKFRRDTIFNDWILLGLCVGTAIFGLVALTLLV